MEKWIMQGQSLAIVMLMLWGIKNHKKRPLHVKIMSLAMAWDIFLILQIQLARGAVQKAAQALTNHMMLNIHVTIAVTTVLLYIQMILTGRKILAGQTVQIPKHRLIGKVTMLLRILTFITSFWAVPSLS